MFSCCGFKIGKLIELKFNLPDGTEIGPFIFSTEETVAQIKSSVVSHWPKDKENVPKKGKYVGVLKGERSLSNSMKLSELVGDDDSEETINVKVVIRPPSSKKRYFTRCFCKGK